MNTGEKPTKLSVIIPAYNEKDNIKDTTKEISQIIESVSEIDDFQVIVVDDHSSDNTYEIINQMKDPRIACIRLSRRSGSFTALRAGIAEAKGDVVLCISADGQDDPSSLKDMMDKWRGGANVVWALRRSRDNERLRIRIQAKAFYLLLSWLVRHNSSAIDLSRADFCLLDSRVIDAVNACYERNTSLFGLIAWLGFKQDFVEYDRRERMRGKSKWNFRSSVDLAIDWSTAFSGLPLKLTSIVGFFVLSIGFLCALLIILRALFGGIPINGWPATMVAILILGGLQMLMLGVFGEYLWRNLDESRKRPLYFIENSTLKDKNG